MPLPNSVQQRDRKGLLLVGHGTRDAAGVAEFFAVAADIAERAGRPLEACFLEIARPTISEGLTRLVDRGVERITVVPLLLFAAGHAKRDIPAAVAEAAAQYPSLIIQWSPTLDCNEQVMALSVRRFREAISPVEPVSAEQTLLLMVGRGSFDPAATAEMHRFTRLRAEQTPVGRALTCFVAMQRPSLAEALAEAAASDFRRIVVQPHLLFSGQLLDEIHREVEKILSEVEKIRDQVEKPAVRESAGGEATVSLRSTRQLILTAALGPEPELLAGVMDLVGRAC